MKNDKSDPSSQTEKEPPETLETIIIKVIARDMENRIQRHEETDKDIKFRNRKYFAVISFMVVAYMIAVLFHIFGNDVQAIEGYLFVITITLVLFLGIIASEVIVFIKNIRRK